MGKLFLLFALMPIIEIALLLQVGEIIGGWNTVAIVILTAFLGATLVRQQGLQTFQNAQNKMQNGQLPSQEVAEGLLLLVAGVLLVTPGFVTDGIGFLFILPISRPILARWLVNNFFSKIKVQSQFTYTQHSQFNDANHPFSRDDTIEGEFSRTDKTSFDQLPNDADNPEKPDQ